MATQTPTRPHLAARMADSGTRMPHMVPKFSSIGTNVLPVP